MGGVGGIIQIIFDNLVKIKHIENKYLEEQATLFMMVEVECDTGGLGKLHWLD